MFKTHSGNVAKERLKLMMNADHQKLDDATMEPVSYTHLTLPTNSLV